MGIDGAEQRWEYATAMVGGPDAEGGESEKQAQQAQQFQQSLPPQQAAQQAGPRC